VPDLFKYYFRPCFDSSDHLIEIFTNVDRKDFMDHFYDTISLMEPIIEDVKDLWMNDEVLFTVRTKFGDLLFSKDTWGTAFIMSKNQDCLSRVNSLLEQNEKFHKVGVDLDKYK
jgi:hypothetical protein